MQLASELLASELQPLEQFQRRPLLPEPWAGAAPAGAGTCSTAFSGGCDALVGLFSSDIAVRLFLVVSQNPSRSLTFNSPPTPGQVAVLRSLAFVINITRIEACRLAPVCAFHWQMWVPELDMTDGGGMDWKASRCPDAAFLQMWVGVNYFQCERSEHPSCGCEPVTKLLAVRRSQNPSSGWSESSPERSPGYLKRRRNQSASADD